MFFIQTDNRVEPYILKERWQKTIQADQNPDKDGKEGQDEESERSKEFNFFEYVKPLETSSRKVQAKLMVSTFMTSPVITLSKEMSLEEARKIFLKHNFFQVAVVSKEGEILGVVEPRDLFGDKRGEKVKDVMSKEILFADKEAHLVEVAQVFFEKSLEWMPIVDENRHVIGIVTRDDLFKTALKLSHLKSSL